MRRILRPCNGSARSLGARVASRRGRPSAWGARALRRRRLSQIGQHDHPHQGVEQLVSGSGQRRADPFAGLRDSARASSRRAWTTLNTAPTTPSAVSGGGIAPRASPPPCLRRSPSDVFQRPRPALQDFGPRRAHPRSAASQSPAPPRRAPAAPTDPPGPARATAPTRREARPSVARDPVSPLQRFLEQRQEAVFAVLELLVERAPRDARAARDPRHAHAAVADLADDRPAAADDPCALNLVIRVRGSPLTTARDRRGARTELCRAAIMTLPSPPSAPSWPS